MLIFSGLTISKSVFEVPVFLSAAADSICFGPIRLHKITTNLKSPAMMSISLPAGPVQNIIGPVQNEIWAESFFKEYEKWVFKLILWFL